MHDIYTSAIIALVIAMYAIWRKRAALKGKEELARHMENILNDKKLNLKEREKIALVYAWDKCADYRFLFKILLPILFFTPKSRTKVQDEKASKEKSKVSFIVLIKAVWVNAKLMPFTYFFIFLSLFVVGVMFSTMSRITSRYKQSVQEFMRDPHIN